MIVDGFIENVGVMGELEGVITSTHDAVIKWGKARNIILFPDFPSCAESLKKRSVQVIVIPGAYPKIRDFILDNTLRAIDSFIFRSPPMVLVSKENKFPESISKIYCAEATTSLAKKYVDLETRIFPVASNPQACRQVISDNGNALAITNMLCAKHFNLYVLDLISNGYYVPYICFSNESEFFNKSDEIK